MAAPKIIGVNFFPNSIFTGANIENILKTSGHSDIAHGVFQVKTLIIFYEPGIYLSQIVVLTVINCFLYGFTCANNNEKN
jgi:hypothetical protein